MQTHPRVIHRVNYPESKLIDPPITSVQQKKKTYPQDWPNYNLAQTQEKSLFMHLLKGLVDTIEDEPKKGPGRAHIWLSDSTFAAMCWQSGSNSSCIRSRASATIRAPEALLVFKT